jgi:PD-(D/E)XK endonuclease
VTCPRCPSRPRPLRRSLFRQQTSSGVATTLDGCSRRIRRVQSQRSQSRLLPRSVGLTSTGLYTKEVVTTSFSTFGGRLIRVQCKWAPRHGDVVVVRCYSTRRNRNGLLRRIYVEGEVDGYAAYCQEIDRCFFLPYENFVRRTQIHLRLDRTNNNQKLGINWADDFDFAATLGNEQGAVAQLGERRHGMPKATGSSPVGSTLFA